MSLRLEMLQVARLAPRQLGESRELVVRFLREHLNPDGGFRNRAGSSDLYYTVFGLDGLLALQAELPAEAAARYFETFGDGAALDFVHRACLLRGWAALGRRPPAGVAGAALAGIERCRSRDGGYATLPDQLHGTAYAAFLALGAYEDAGQDLPGPGGVLESLEALRASDGSYANQPGQPSGLTPVTAAAVLVRRHLGDPAGREAGMWLLDRCHPRGGFFAAPSAPVPDLLSTATALHALTSLQVPLGALREPCLDFVDSLWTNRGGFYGTWADDEPDCEYTYYALLALGHLSL